MILFHDRANDIQVIRTTSQTTGSYNGSDNVGVLRQPDTGEKNPGWIWDTDWTLNTPETGRYKGENFELEEKLCIIGMLDKLNGFGYRRIGTRQARWREITGLPEATF